MKPVKLLVSVIICLTVFLPMSSNLSLAASNDNFDAHESFAKLHFNDSEMDFAFALILGATMNHGCEVGEADNYNNI